MTAVSNDSSDNPIAAQLQAIRQQIPDYVRLIAVTKKFSPEVIRTAYQAGLRDFGESQVQEAAMKQAALADLQDITWHLIGHLQTNKVRKALDLFSWIHSVDSLKLAKRLDQIAAEKQVRPACCIQVKMVPDPPKYGFDLDNFWPVLSDLNQLENLHIVGLMTIPPLNLDAAATGEVFQQAQCLAEEINAAGYEHIHIHELSMGMSGDYPLAIAAGSTMIRLGTKLFGARPVRSPSK